MYISLLLHLIKTHELFSSFFFYEQVGIVGGFEEKVGKIGSKQKSRKSRKKVGTVESLQFAPVGI